MLVRKFFLALAAFTFLALYLFLVYSILVPFLAPLAWAAIIVIATFPLYRRLRARLRGRSNLASAIMTPVVVLLLAIPIIVVVFTLVAEIDGVLDQLQVRMATGNGPAPESAEELPAVGPVVGYLTPLLDTLGISLQETVAPAVQNLAGTLVERTKDVARISFNFVLGFFLLSVTLFFFYREGERWMELFWSIIPLPEEQKKVLGNTVENVLSAVLYGIFLTSIIQGVLGFIGYLLAGLPSPLLLGALTIIAALLPGIGTALVWLPGAIYLLISGKVVAGIFLLAWGGIVVATTDNFIRPYFISGRGHLPFLAVLLGILGGLVVFGFVGMILGPIVLALFFTVLNIYRDLLPPGVGTPEENPAEPDGPA